MNVRPFVATALLGLLAACASAPSPRMQRADQLPGEQVGGDASVRTDALPEVMGNAGPRPVIRRGSGAPINQSAASAPPPSLASSGQASFNFEGESLHAVVKAILGDMLGQSYSIAPGVQGTVTIATQKPVGSAGALNLLEGVLAQNNARMVFSDGRYNIVPADQALASGVVPRTGSPAMARGYESRVVPLRYVSAAEMEKILKPYARQGAIVSVDGARNIITVAGTRAELENYLRTVQVFDVDWMASMSVGVFPLQSGRASQLVQDLERVFGEQSKTPVAGMFRFMPLDAANAVMVITSQPNYLDDIQQWIDRIEGGSGEGRLFSYELKYIKARDLADRLAEVFGNGAGQSQQGEQPSLMPGVESTQIRSGGVDDKGGTSSAAIGSGGDGASLPSGGTGNGRVTLRVDGTEVGVSAVEDTNSLLVRASPAAWKSIREVIERLDVMPMQVHIEAQVVSVVLSGALQYGVSWFFDNAIPEQTDFPYPTGRNSWGSYGSSVAPAEGFGNALDNAITGNGARQRVRRAHPVLAFGVHPEQQGSQPQRRPAHPDQFGQLRPDQQRQQQRHLQPGAVPGHRHHPQGAPAHHPRRHGVHGHRAGSQQAGRRGRRQRQRAHRHQRGSHQCGDSQRRDHHAGRADHRWQQQDLVRHPRAQPDPGDRRPVRPAGHQHHAR